MNELNSTTSAPSIIPIDIMTMSELSQLLHIKEKTLRQWIYQGKIPSLKINGLVRFSRKAIHHWIAASSRGQS